jgi:hypothetical protein
MLLLYLLSWLLSVVSWVVFFGLIREWSHAGSQQEECKLQVAALWKKVAQGLGLSSMAGKGDDDGSSSESNNVSLPIYFVVSIRNCHTTMLVFGLLQLFCFVLPVQTATCLFSLFHHTCCLDYDLPDTREGKGVIVER